MTQGTMTTKDRALVKRASALSWHDWPLVADMEETEGYVETVKGIVGDNDFNVTVMVNAETGIPYVFSVDASGAKGDFSGEMLGMNGVVTYSCDDLYATAVIEACTDEIDVPEEILELVKSK